VFAINQPTIICRLRMWSSRSAHRRTRRSWTSALRV
jgi:hypothetical protein